MKLLLESFEIEIRLFKKVVTWLGILALVFDIAIYAYMKCDDYSKDGYHIRLWIEKQSHYNPSRIDLPESGEK